MFYLSVSLSVGRSAASLIYLGGLKPQAMLPLKERFERKSLGCLSNGRFLDLVFGNQYYELDPLSIIIFPIQIRDTVKNQHNASLCCCVFFGGKQSWHAEKYVNSFI